MDHIQPVVDALSSEQAIRVYLFAAIVLTYIGCAYCAYRSTASLRAFLAAGITFNVHGNVKKCETIKRKIAELDDESGIRRNSSIRQAFLVLLYAVLIPGFLLAIVACAADFLFPDSPVPVMTADASNPNMADIVVFVVDQTLRGGLSDAFEVFGLSLTDVQINSENWFFFAVCFNSSNFVRRGWRCCFTCICERSFWGARLQGDKKATRQDAGRGLQG